MINKFQEGGLPSVNVDTGFLSERINPVNIGFDPNPRNIVDNTIGAIQLGLQRDQQRISERQLDQSERRLDMDVMKFNKDLIAGALKQNALGTDPTYGINAFTEKGRKLISAINEEKTKSMEQANALWAETLVSGKVNPMNIGKLNQAMSGVDKILNSDDYVFHVSANKAYQSTLDELYKNLDDPNIVVNTEEFRKKEEKLLQVMDSDSSNPRDFRIADLMDMKNVFLKRQDIETELSGVIDMFEKGNTKKIEEFYRGNTAIIQGKTIADLTNAENLYNNLFDYLNSTSQGRAYIEQLGGEEKAKQYLKTKVALRIPEIGKKVETVTSIDTSRWEAGVNNDKSTSTSSGTQVDRNRESNIGVLRNMGYDVDNPVILDDKVSIEIPVKKADGTVGSNTRPFEGSAAQAIQLLKNQSDQNGPEAQAIKKALGIKNYTPQSQGAVGDLNVNQNGAIQTDFSKINPSETNWESIAGFESAGGTNTRAYLDSGVVTVGNYGLRGPNIQKFFKDKFGVNVDTSSPSSVQAVWDEYSTKPGFEEKQRDWISKNIHEQQLKTALKYIPVMDNSIKMYLTDAAHNLSPEGFEGILKRSEVILKDKGLTTSSNPYDVLEAIHQARVEKNPELKDSRLDDLYAKSAANASEQAKIVANLPFKAESGPKDQSHQSLLELEYGMLQDMEKVFAGGSPLIYTSAARGKYHPATQANEDSLHPRQRAVDFKYNDTSINTFKSLTGLSSFEADKYYPIQGTNLQVMFETNPKHFHLEYRGEKVEVPAPKKAGNPNQETLNDLYLLNPNPMAPLGTTSTPQPTQQADQQVIPQPQFDQKTNSILSKIDKDLRK